jgi:hypothetical protein
MSLEEQCREVLTFMQTSAPNLRPRIIPRGYNDKDLAAFCTSEDDRRCLYQTIKDNRPNKCMIQGCGVESDKLIFTTFWNLDINKKTYTLSDVQYLCKNCYACLSIEHFLSKMTSQQSKIDQNVQHFLAVNNLPSTKQYIAQQIYNDAYALQVLSSNVPQYQIGIYKKKQIEPIVDQSHTIKDILNTFFSKSPKQQQDDSSDEDE